MVLLGTDRRARATAPALPDGAPPVGALTRAWRALASATDYVRILRAGVFMHSAYAAMHLGSRRLSFLALPHYLASGASRGLRANPFVDPGLRDALGRPMSLARFCRDGGALAPGPDFDPAWYAALVPPRVSSGRGFHPFLHFWRTGFAAGLDPSPDFDTSFFKEVVGLFRPDKEELAYELSVGGAGFPRAQAELVARQDAYRAAIAMRVLRYRPTVRRFLVFVQASGGHVVPYGDDRSFDVLLNVYDGSLDDDLPLGAVGAGPDKRAEIVVAQSGTKATAVSQVLLRAPRLLSRYDAVAFLDDDVVVSGPDLDRMFGIFESHGLDLAQPALTADSACAFEALKRPAAGAGVRPLSMVEIMAPVVSRRALLTCGAAFDASVSGWGVDALLSKMVRARFGDTVALVADVVASHVRPVDVGGGALYAHLRAHGIDPFHEVALVARLHGTSPWPDAVQVLDRPGAPPRGGDRPVDGVHSQAVGAVDMAGRRV